jgi:hypothetical protein
MTGWSTVLLGGLCLALSALQAVAPLVLRHLDEMLAPGDDPGRAMRDAWSAGAGMGAIVNALFGVALIVIGVGVARRSRWAHSALELSCWASIVVLAILAKPSLAPFFAMGGEGASSHGGILAAAVVLVAAQAGAVLWFLRFWRKAEVKDAFRRTDAGAPTDGNH